MRRLRNVLMAFLLGLAVMAGAPVRVEEIDELMEAMNQPKVAHTLAEENFDSNPVDESGIYRDRLAKQNGAMTKQQSGHSMRKS